MNKDEIWLFFLVLIIGVLLGFGWGTVNGKHMKEMEAIKTHNAHYETNENGEPKFVWNNK